ncbi:diguanylate cyclase domain-containing protein [Roseateles saccharophilus]|nr:diguanylate cyclase [Roseateles saccharophilus]MDG0834909.1 sensor domain-containing diguanylate cyclase [Roseateles saccharophilus]
MSEPATPTATPTPEAAQRRARRRRWRDRILVLAPSLAFGSVILTLWALVAWYVAAWPGEVRAQQRHELATALRAVAMRTGPVLHEADGALRVVDLWLRNPRGGDPLADPALAQLADGIRSGSGQFVDVMLVARSGRLLRLQHGGPPDGASIAGSAAFAQLAGLAPGAVALGLPLQLDGHQRLPLLMRLSRPQGDHDAVLAVVDLQRLRDAQAPLMPGALASLVMLRGDGVVLSRQPEVPGFAGRNLYDEFPQRRSDFAGSEGFFASTGVLTDGRARVGAFVTIGDAGLKLLLSDTEDAGLAAHRQQRALLLAGALLLSLGLAALARWLGRQQRAARLRDAALQATSNAVPLGLFRCDETGRIVYVNDSYLRVHGMRREDIAWGWTTLVPPEQREPLIERWKQHMASGEPIDMVRKMKRGDDGRIRWIAVRTAPLIIGGRVAGQAGTVEDVTERGEQERAHRTLAAIFDMTPDIVCQARENGDVSYMNPVARERFGIAPDAPLDGARIEHFLSPGQIQVYQRIVLPTVMREGHWQGRTQVQAGAEGLPVDCTVLAHRDVRGRIETVSVIMRDVSEQQRAQRERERSEAMLLAVAHTARAQFLVGDTAGRVIFFNAAFEQQRRIALQDWVGRPLAELFGPRDYAARAPLIAAALAGETHHVDLVDGGERDGRSFDAQYAPLRVQSGQIEGVIGIEVDVTEARQEEARLRLASQTDALTQLLNRSGFEEGARRLLDAPPGRRLALLYLDLDRFKPVNDQHGHPTGDALLKAVALRMRHALRPGDLVARLGGDEFAVLLPQLQGPGDASTVAAKLLQAISTPYHIGDLKLEIGVSIGYCVAPGGSSLEALVASADASLYEAKRAGRGRCQGGAIADA